jgi:hypothetical protein
MITEKDNFMKRIYVLLGLCAIFYSTNIFSQHIAFGIDPGLSLSQGSYKPSAGLDRRIFAGFDGGVLLEVGVTPKFMIQPEANFSIVGVELNNGEKEATIKLRYITVPLLAKVSVSKKFNLMAGPQVGFLVSAKRDSSFTNEIIDLEQDFKKQDYGLMFGADYKFNRSIFLGVRYYHGLHQIAEEGNDFEMRNRYVSFRVGYIFCGK